MGPWENSFHLLPQEKDLSVAPWALWSSCQPPGWLSVLSSMPYSQKFSLNGTG